jgi:hypothetical protein
MAISETTKTAATTRTKARARKTKERRKVVDLKKLPPAAHTAAAAALLEKEQTAAERKRDRKRGPAHPAIEGQVYVVVCAKCGDLKARKHYGDALGWQRSHSAENKGHAVVIEQRDAAEAEAAKQTVKKANRKDGQKNA